MKGPVAPSSHFPTREDAAWLLLSFTAFWGSWAVALVSIRLTGYHVVSSVVVPVVLLVMFSTALLEICLRRLNMRLTGKRLPRWPFGSIGLSRTLIKALSPSMLAEAGDRIGLSGIAVAGFVYAVIAIDLMSLVTIPG
jgi:hypothetical protein